MQIDLSLIDLPVSDARFSVDEDALEEMVASLRDHGQLQPIRVKPTDNGRFEVVFGARRTRAAQILLWDQIDATMWDPNNKMDPEALKLIENVQRLEMTPIEEAHSLLKLVGEAEINIRELQRQTGKGREWVRSRLELATMPEDLQGAVQAGVIPIGVALIFATITHDEIREQYTRNAVENGCTTNQARIWASMAPYAAQGLMTMDEINQAAQDPAKEPQISDQIYHCFVCTAVTNWRRCNPLMVCSSCQDAIIDSRRKPQDSPVQYPVDTNILDV